VKYNGLFQDSYFQEADKGCNQ